MDDKLESQQSIIATSDVISKLKECVYAVEVASILQELELKQELEPSIFYVDRVWQNAAHI